MTLIKTKNGIKGRQPKGEAGLLCSIMICITNNHKWEGKPHSQVDGLNINYCL